MTRFTRSDDEAWAADMLLGALNSDSHEWSEQPGAPTDAPDLRLCGPGGRRIACEITRVGRSEWFCWQNARGQQLPTGRLDEMSIPREVDLWLEHAIAAKAGRVPTYIQNAAADEAWLLVHGGLNRVFDFFALSDDEAYDIPLLVAAAEGIDHPFKRIYVASSNSARIVRVFPFDGTRREVPDITLTSVLRVLTIRSFATVAKLGVNKIPLGREFRPDRSRILPPLDTRRLRR